MIDELIDYVICLPSGEVISMTNADIMYLKRLDLVWSNDKLMKFVTRDINKGEIYKFLNSKNNSSKSQIENFLGSCGLEKDHYKILEDDGKLSVDVYAELNISHKKLYKIPFKLNRVTSNFNCSNNELVTLENCPKQVHGDFNCGFNF